MPENILLLLASLFWIWSDQAFYEEKGYFLTISYVLETKMMC